MVGAPAVYRLLAYNSARQSENKMHDDGVARQFGFGGGLVPGVDVYAYMTHPAVTHWGSAFLDGGRFQVRFLKPVYDGELATVTAREADGGLAIDLSCRDELCATGEASLPGAAPPPMAAFTMAAAVEPRPPADAESLRVGRWLGIRPLAVTAAFATQYLADVREEHGLYAAEGLCHPGLLPRLMNWALTHNVVLGPWIHVGSTVEHFARVAIGDQLRVGAKIVANYERKGHRFVELEGLIVANDTTPIARVSHSAIWRPRAAAG